MTAETAEILSHLSNGGIVQLPGRRFPGIVMQGDSLSLALENAVFLLEEFRRAKDEERFYQALEFVQQLHGQLAHYEETLGRLGMSLPYTKSVRDVVINDEFDDD